MKEEVPYTGIIDAVRVSGVGEGAIFFKALEHAGVWLAAASTVGQPGLPQ